MILRLTAEQLRKLADQVDALTAMERAGADHLESGTVLKVDGEALAYTYWWDDADSHVVEFINFTPAHEPPLAYHSPDGASTPPAMTKTGPSI